MRSPFFMTSTSVLFRASRGRERHRTTFRRMYRIGMVVPRSFRMHDAEPNSSRCLESLLGSADDHSDRPCTTTGGLTDCLMTEAYLVGLFPCERNERMQQHSTNWSTPRSRSRESRDATESANRSKP